MATQYVNVDASHQTYINGNSPTTNYGNTLPIVGWLSTDNAMRVLLRFDLSAFPANGVLVPGQTTFSFYFTAVTTSGGNRAGHIYRCRRYDWSPGSGGTDVDATYNQYKTGSNWTTAGALSTVSDYDATLGVAVTWPSTTGQKSFGSSLYPALETLVQDAITNQSKILNIIAVFDAFTPSVTESGTIRSVTYFDESQRPQMSVGYQLRTGKAGAFDDSFGL